MLDIEGYRALRRGELGQLAMDRGFDRLATVAYREPHEMGLSATTPAEQLPRYFGGLMRGMRPVGKLHLTLDYLSPSGRCAVFRRWPDGADSSEPF